MNQDWRRSLYPKPQVSKLDTSLRYTDILFGFVIKELFTRLQHWSVLSGEVQLHLVVGTVLVLGSWIGYRRSMNRSAYEVKFFNLPFFRFLADQLMLILYFRIAVLTDLDRAAGTANLSEQTLRLVIYVFVLYLVWDGLGLWMALTRDPFAPTQYRYPKFLEDKTPTSDPAPADFAGFWITYCTLVVLLILNAWWTSRFQLWILVIVGILLLAYRWCKEVRSSLKA